TPPTPTRRTPRTPAPTPTPSPTRRPGSSPAPASRAAGRGGDPPGPAARRGRSYHEPVQIHVVGYEHPDVAELTAPVQQEEVQRCGSGAATPWDGAGFAPPGGPFLGGDGAAAAVACGGGRARSAPCHGHLDGDAELKRMYVAEAARGRVHARRLLAALEDTA